LRESDPPMREEWRLPRRLLFRSAQFNSKRRLRSLHAAGSRIPSPSPSAAASGRRLSCLVPSRRLRSNLNRSPSSARIAGVGHSLRRPRPRCRKTTVVSRRIAEERTSLRRRNVRSPSARRGPRRLRRLHLREPLQLLRLPSGSRPNRRIARGKAPIRRKTRSRKRTTRRRKSRRKTIGSESRTTRLF
jgi:hypothetical protein